MESPMNETYIPQAPFIGHGAFAPYPSDRPFSELMIRPTKLLRAKRIKQKRRAKRARKSK